MKNFAKRVLDFGASPIKEMAAAVKKDPEVISLAQGLPSFSTPKHIREAAASALLADEKGIGAYSLYSGTRELKQAIAKKLEEEYVVAGLVPAKKATTRVATTKIDSEREIFVTVGAMEGLSACILAIVNPGDEVILPTPNYPPHGVQVRLAGGKPVFVSLSGPKRVQPLRVEPYRKVRAELGLLQKKWTWNLEDLKKAISKKTKLIVLTNPGNPTGCVFDYELLAGIVELAKKHGVWVMADETYSFLTYNGLPHTSLGIFRSVRHKDHPSKESSSRLGYDNVIVVRSFSKEYAMTGWRLGYVYAPAKMVEQALKVHDALVGCPSTISQKGALAALTGPQDAVDEFRKELFLRRELMSALLDKLSDYFEYTKPAGAYYMWVKLNLKAQMSNVKTKSQSSKLKNVNSTDFAIRLLEEAKVAVVPGSAFGPSGEGYLRMCFAVSREEIEEAFRRIRGWLKG